MPPGIEQAYLFQVFNTISWQIVQGLPILLFFKFMGASDTILGLVASLNPLMMMLQIPAANYIEKVGYRNFALRGWTARTGFVAAVTTVPLLLFSLDGATCMMLTLFFLFIYSILRGISTCAFLPWITQLVPEKVRGTYISRDQTFSAVAGFGTMVGVAILLYPKPTNVMFSLTFFISFACGLISLFFLRRMPDVPVPPSPEKSEPVPWKSMIFFPPFWKLMRYNLVMNSAIAASNVFWMPVLRTDFHWRDWQILSLASITTLTSMGMLWFFGRMIDRVGSLPLLHLGAFASVFNLLAWFLTISRVVPMNAGWIFFIGFTGGLGTPLFNLANTRLVMATVPVEGRSHYFALYSVANSLILGLLPILWGLGLDSLKNFQWTFRGATFDHYSILYCTLIVTVLSSFIFWDSLEEGRAMTSEEFFRELLVETPGRVLVRLWRNRPFTNP